jgi:hypothetical protein
MYTPDYGKNPQRMVIDCEFGSGKLPLPKWKFFFQQINFFVLFCFFLKQGHVVSLRQALAQNPPTLDSPVL